MRHFLIDASRSAILFRCVDSTVVIRLQGGVGCLLTTPDGKNSSRGRTPFLLGAQCIPWLNQALKLQIHCRFGSHMYIIFLSRGYIQCAHAAASRSHRTGSNRNFSLARLRISHSDTLVLAGGWGLKVDSPGFISSDPICFAFSCIICSRHDNLRTRPPLAIYIQFDHSYLHVCPGRVPSVSYL